MLLLGATLLSNSVKFSYQNDYLEQHIYSIKRFFNKVLVTSSKLAVLCQYLLENLWNENKYW